MKMLQTAAVAATLLTTAAAQAAPANDKVTAEVIGVSDVQVGLGGARFTVVTAVTRKKFPPMVLTELRYDVLVGGQKIGEGRIEEKHRLKRNQAVSVEIPTQLSASAGMMALMGGSTELTISGEVSGRWLFFSQKREFERTLSLDDLINP